MIRKNTPTDLKMKIYNESLSRGIYIYIGKKKENANLVIPTEKNKRHAIGWSKEENNVRAAKLEFTTSRD